MVQLPGHAAPAADTAVCERFEISATVPARTSRLCLRVSTLRLLLQRNATRAFAARPRTEPPHRPRTATQSKRAPSPALGSSTHGRSQSHCTITSDHGLLQS